MHDARLHAEIVDTPLAIGAFVVDGAHKTTLPIDALLLRITTVRVRLAEAWYSRASHIIGLAAEVVHAATLCLVVVHLAHCIRPAFHRFTRILAQKHTAHIGQTGGKGGTIVVAVGAGAWMTTTIIALLVRITNEVCWTGTCERTNFVLADSQLVTRV